MIMEKFWQHIGLIKLENGVSDQELKSSVLSYTCDVLFDYYLTHGL